MSDSDVTARTALTYQDYAALPDDGKRYEVHDGELSPLPAPTTVHQIVSAELAMALLAHVKRRNLGLVLIAPLDVILSDRPNETTIVQPDILFLDQQRLSLISDRAIEGAPALVIEILLPSTAVIDRGRKRELYARYGVPHLWFVDPDAREINAHVLDSSGYRLTVRASGTDAIDLPPFTGLGLVPTSLWPEFPIRL
jgi:Uma2 family endonuclease